MKPVALFGFETWYLPVDRRSLPLTSKQEPVKTRDFNLARLFQVRRNLFRFVFIVH
jgi:hypothetical protein